MTHTTVRFHYIHNSEQSH
ncbi:hypothetical protein HID58_014537 [Brassica napus]|uniref:Uncharacterized protein n=1 Tax=Brassica napus TaxID=3708 RepID=A0ABQ8DK08_BRANA|nr:hypothetical protein HID58_014537 [Brassica napus]